MILRAPDSSGKQGKEEAGEACGSSGAVEHPTSPPKVRYLCGWRWQQQNERKRQRQQRQQRCCSNGASYQRPPCGREIWESAVWQLSQPAESRNGEADRQAPVSTASGMGPHWWGSQPAKPGDGGGKAFLGI
ncbi:hypothetical protein E2320_015542 [Naja naja]|nr:hypothetical protein E2320_015542 [Naja naja]